MGHKVEKKENNMDLLKLFIGDKYQIPKTKIPEIQLNNSKYKEDILHKLTEISKN
jgi:hypothetical protein